MRRRTSTPLELLFDLCFVVAVSQAGAPVHHGLAEVRVGPALLGYVMLFFAIWWAWMNFTWFASAYDTNDAQYRVLSMVQIAGGIGAGCRGCLRRLTTTTSPRSRPAT